MSIPVRSVRIEFSGGSWAFIDPHQPANRVKFDQALVDATYVSSKRVEGFVRSVHGVDIEIAQFMDVRTKESLGITACHKLGRGPTLRRVRLMPDGSTEQVGYQ